jgi:hypothetical protein
MSFIPLTESLLMGIKEFLNVPYTSVMASKSGAQQLRDTSSVSLAPPSTTHSTNSASAPTSAAAIDDENDAESELEMTRGPAGLGSVDAQYIFEIVGTLLSQPWVESGKRIAYTKIVIDPLLGSLEAGLAHLHAQDEEEKKRNHNLVLKLELALSEKEAIKLKYDNLKKKAKDDAFFKDPLQQTSQNLQPQTEQKA